MAQDPVFKQALLATLCGHPDAAKYRAAAFPNGNIPADAFTPDKASLLKKTDLLTPDNEGKYIIDSAGFWKNFNFFREVLARQGEVFTAEDLTKPLSSVDQHTLLDSAQQHRGLGALFSAAVWRGRYDEMENLWFKVPVPDRRSLFKNDGFISLELKRELLSAEGRTPVEDSLAKSGLKLSDIRAAFAERGNYEAVVSKLDRHNDYLRKEYLLAPQNDIDGNRGHTVFYFQQTWERFSDIVKNLAEHGERFELADFLKKSGYAPNILYRAGERNALAHVFSPDIWQGRLSDMIELWSHVPAGWKPTSLSNRDFDLAYAEAEGRTYGSGIDWSSLKSKQQLTEPLDNNVKPVRPIGLKAFWDNVKEVPAALIDTVSLQDLRLTSGAAGNTALMSAAKAGKFSNIANHLKKRGESPTLDDFLAQDNHGQSLLSVLADRRELPLAFTPEFWVERTEDMKVLWSHVRRPDQGQVNMKQLEVDVQLATLRKKSNKGKFQLKPK